MVRIWDLTHDRYQMMFADVPVALSRDRIFGSTGKHLKVWNLQTAKLEAALERGWISHSVVMPDGKHLAVLTHNLDPNKVQIKIWQRP
jgi:hypothetical protein